MRTALYLRVSKDGKQDADNQRLQLRQFCQSQNWQIVREYQDLYKPAARATVRSSARCYMTPPQGNGISCCSGHWTGSPEKGHWPP